MKSIHHSFDVDLAVQFGMEKAVIIHHFQHWIRLNRRKKKNIRDGHCWSYQKREDISAHLPYLTLDSVRYHLEDLVEKGILKTANYNRAKFDKTLWYAFVDEERFGVDQKTLDDLDNSNNFYERGKPRSKGENPVREGENPTPIPDTKKEDAKEGVSKDTQERAQKAPSAPKFSYHLISMPEDSYRKLIEDFGEARVKTKLEALHEYSEIKSKKFREYTDHAKVLRKWLREDQQIEPKIQTANPEKKNSVVWKGKKIL